MPVSDTLYMLSSMTTADWPRKRAYLVSADYQPFRWWMVDAEGECDARQQIADRFGIALEELEAKLANAEEIKRSNIV
jgi:hypothetical protein